MSPLAAGDPAGRTPATGVVRVAALLLAAVAVVYAAIGVWAYATAGQGDLRLRWLEKVYVLQGWDPLDPARAADARATGVPELGSSAGYAPWSYVYAMLFAPGPDPDRAAAIFLAFNIAALAYLAAFGYRRARLQGGSGDFGLLGAAGMVAFLAVPVVLRHGNYGLIVTALLAGMLECLDARRPVLAGVLLGLALVKPQLAALFVLVPLVRRQWPCVLVAALLVSAAWLAAALLVHRPPLMMLAEMLQRGSSFTDAYQGVFAGISALGVPKPLASLFGLGAGGLITAWLCWRYRGVGSVALAAIPAVMSTVWSYHRTHDLMVLGFLGLAAILLWAARGRRLGWATLLLFAVTWVPYFNAFNVGFWLPTLFRAVWITALVAALEGTASAQRRGELRQTGAAVTLN